MLSTPNRSLRDSLVTPKDAEDEQYAYDLADRLTQAAGTAANGTFTMAYDNLGRLKRSDSVYSFQPGNTWTVQYTYDQASNRKTLVDPQNVTTTYTYDNLFQLTSLASPQGTFGFSYDALGRRTALNRPGSGQNKVNTTYAYSPKSELLSVLHKKGTTTLDGTTYTYGPAGNRLTRQDNRLNVTPTYNYDNIYQLLGTSQGGGITEAYVYDLVGNRTSFAQGGVVYDLNYNSSNQLTSVLGGATYTYDANGNPLTKVENGNTTTYTWDLENRLISVAGPFGTTTFKYDPFGRRIQKSGPAGVVNYVYDGDNVLEEVSAAGAVVAKYTMGLGVDEPIAMARGGAMYYYGQDGLGSVTSLFTTSATLAATYTYNSYGKVVSSTGSVTNPYLFTGREYDTETGLYYYRARYYDPQVGRFLSEDPIQFSGGSNFYRYVNNSPTNYIDPFG